MAQNPLGHVTPDDGPDMTGALPLYMGMPSGHFEWVGDPLEEYVYRCLHRDLQWPPEFVGWLIESRNHYRLQMPNPQDEQCRLGRLTVALMLAVAVAVSPMVAPVLAAFPPPAAGATDASPLFSMAGGATARAAAGSPEDDEDGGVAAQAAGIAAMHLSPYVPPVAVGSVTAASTASAVVAAWAEDRADEARERPVARGRAALRRHRSPSPPLPGQRRRAAGKRLLHSLRRVCCVLYVSVGARVARLSQSYMPLVCRRVHSSSRSCQYENAAVLYTLCGARSIIT